MIRWYSCALQFALKPYASSKMRGWGEVRGHRGFLLVLMNTSDSSQWSTLKSNTRAFKPRAQQVLLVPPTWT